MLRIEVECIKRRKRSSVLEHSYTIRSGDVKNVDYLRRTRILIFGPADNGKGKAMIAGKENGISVLRYESKEDNLGEGMGTDRPIEISGNQELSVTRKCGKVTKGVVVFVNDSGDDENQENDPNDPKDNLDKNLPKIFAEIF